MVKNFRWVGSFLEETERELSMGKSEYVRSISKENGQKIFAGFW